MSTNTVTTNIDFLGYRYICFGLSLLLLISFIGGAWYKYQERGSVFLYSVDFTGGTQILLDFSKNVKSEEVLTVLEANGFAGATAREFSEHEVLIRVKEFASDAKGLGSKIQLLLEEKIAGAKVEVVQIESVGPGIGAELRQNSLWAIILGLILMLMYIWWRFWSLSYGVGSVVALMHDTLVILSFILWFDYEISLNVISAMLFILGYSINDTIVIFARIREVLARKQHDSVPVVINRSINETLRRTILTSFATMLVVVALLLFGGEVLKLLSISLLIGIVFGTYSSIYIASPVMLLLYKETK